MKIKEGQTRAEAWAEYKVEFPTIRPDDRAVPAMHMHHVKGSRDHECSHAPKHHKRSGRCRKGCACTWGARQATRKQNNEAA